MMKKRRPIISTTLFSFLILFALGILALRGAPAQTRPEAKPSASPSPNQELLKVEPAAQQNPSPGASPQKSPTKPSTKIELPQGEVDDKTPVITNTDLITFNVTVTDIYGRFVSGLSKNAFTIFDEKEQQEITFFSDEDAPVGQGASVNRSGPKPSTSPANNLRPQTNSGQRKPPE
jgi:hypothetical protein